MLIWRGWGILAFALPMGACVLVWMGLEHFLGEARTQSNPWFLGASLALSSVLVSWLGWRRNRREIVDQQTGMCTRVKGKHDLFFVPMEDVGVAGILVGLFLAFNLKSLF